MFLWVFLKLDRLVFMGTIKTGRVKSRGLSKDTGYGKLDYLVFTGFGSCN